MPDEPSEQEVREFCDRCSASERGDAEFLANTAAVRGRGAAEATAVEAWSIVEQLRAPEGAEVCLFCDSPDFNNGANSAIEVCDDWTGWKDIRFEGDTVLEALRVALKARQGKVDT